MILENVRPLLFSGNEISGNLFFEVTGAAISKL